MKTYIFKIIIIITGHESALRWAGTLAMSQPRRAGSGYPPG